MDYHSIITRYYRSFRERDLEELRALLTPACLHVSSFGEWRNRDAMLAAIWPNVGQKWAAELEIFGEAPSFMVRYQLTSSFETAGQHMAEFVRFEGGQIAEIEVYFGCERKDP